MPQAKPTPGPLLLDPADHTLILVDLQSRMAFATIVTATSGGGGGDGIGLDHAKRMFGGHEGR